MIVPECRRRTQHVLTERPHHAIRSWSISDNICCSKNETNDQADSFETTISCVLLYQAVSVLG